MKTIPLTQGKEAMVDDEDYDRLAAHKWHFNKKNKRGYGCAQRSKYIKLGVNSYKSQTVYLHREVLNTNEEVDHIDGNTLDCRKHNLRPANRIQQTQNTSSRVGSSSKYVGVHMHKLTGKWRAQIQVDGKVKSLGLFSTEELAHSARTRYIESNGLDRFRR